MNSVYDCLEDDFLTPEEEKKLIEKSLENTREYSEYSYPPDAFDDD